MNLTLGQLKAFSAVAQNGSFTMAGKNLGLTQSAVSILLRELERNLGVRLFDRHTRQVRLTEAGRRLLPAVERSLEDLSLIAAQAADIAQLRAGDIRIGAAQLVACTLLPELLQSYGLKYPAIKFRIFDAAPEGLRDLFVSERVELALGPDVDVGPDVVKELLATDRHFLVCTASHPLAGQERVEWADLAGAHLIVAGNDLQSRIKQVVLGLGLSELFASITNVSFMTTAIGMASAGVGVTICPSYASRIVEGYGLRMLPLGETPFLRQIFLYRASRVLSPAAEDFCTHARAALRRTDLDSVALPSPVRRTEAVTKIGR